MKRGWAIVADPLFLDRAQAMAGQLVAWRREIHRHPELGGREDRTAALVAAALREAGLEVRHPVAGTGVVGLLPGAGPGPWVALRADLDALPLTEETGLPFASANPGVMHACGHDAHAAMLLGAARLLCGARGELGAGGVKFIFQPCEEQLPGGARAMLAAGVLQDPPVAGIIGLHVDPWQPAGVVGLAPGTVMAAVDSFQVLVSGRGGHGAAPHQAVDAVLAAAHAVVALQAIVSRQTNPLQPLVITVGSIHGGRQENIIADRVELLGTVRTLDGSLRQQVPALLERTLAGVTTAFGASHRLDYRPGHPPLVNDPAWTELVRAAARRELGPGRVLPLAGPSMGSEDFACYAQEVPAAYFFLGAAPPGQAFPWHHPRFDLAEEALPAGAAVLARAAFDFLRGKEAGENA